MYLKVSGIWILRRGFDDRFIRNVARILPIRKLKIDFAQSWSDTDDIARAIEDFEFLVGLELINVIEPVRLRLPKLFDLKIVTKTMEKDIIGKIINGCQLRSLHYEGAKLSSASIHRLLEHPLLRLELRNVRIDPVGEEFEILLKKLPSYTLHNVIWKYEILNISK